MVNDIFYQRICTFIANAFALDPKRVWSAYEKVGSIDSIIKMARNGTLDKVFSIDE